MLFTKQNNHENQTSIWLYVDMEGINNISTWNQVNPACKEYKKNRKKLTRETNSAVKGCIKGGASKVLINDLHWFYDNLLLTKLSKKAECMPGESLNISDFINQNFDAVGIVGMHAMAHTENAILPHSWYLPTYIDSLRYNEELIGEIAIINLLAKEKGVPVIFISGDKAGCNEAIKEVPEISIACTKNKVNNKINFLSERKANNLVCKIAKTAVQTVKLTPENKLKSTTKSSLKAAFATKALTDIIEKRCKEKKLNAKRIDTKTVEFKGIKPSDIFQNFFSVLD